MRAQCLDSAGCDHNWQSDGEAGTLSITFAFNPHSAAMKLYQTTYNGQTQSQSRALTVGAGIALTKTIKHEGQQLWLNPHAGVTDDYFDFGVDPLRMDLNAAILGCELNCIR